MIYMDYAATTPIREEALNAFIDASKNYYGNPSSLHDIGSKASTLLETCRIELAKLIGGQEEGIFFTSGGSESNILAIRSLLKGTNKQGKHLITTQIEHSSVLNLFKQLEDEGYTVTYLGVDSYGQIDLQELKESITVETVLASIHHANSEIGTIQPIEEVGSILKEHNVLFHTDTVQTFGKIPVHVLDSHIDSLSISSHKIYGPKGVGACYINPTIKWTPYFDYTSHEKGFRPGTVNVPGIVSFLYAAQLIHQEMDVNDKRLSQLRTTLLNGIEEKALPIHIEGHPTNVLSNIIGAIVKGIEGQLTMLECNRRNIAISTGSACSVGKQAPSKTMIATGKDPQTAKQFIRLSIGRHTTETDIAKVLEVLDEITSK
ncbi:IscS subfamily cysteine desulfurase [Bacillus suaedaesalsae]|uniref:IscS subfamily cysteine desulfurase n=1 Tax=Bacillus suaedaesalsae TaxID=2810349 RepID=A0ABS2DMK5_9BACI|nr:IscS subfamily cysteine desulfurase [Bacillus suaedaesalsae]MBM6619732.1 IscS subfamily cysteine desulfurase [Bacillus suaedaesalsae]